MEIPSAPPLSELPHDPMAFPLETQPVSIQPGAWETAAIAPAGFNSQSLPISSSWSTGLEILAELNRLLINQTPTGTCLGSAGSNEYYVTDQYNRNLFVATEESSWCGRQCLYEFRPFTISITEYSSQKEVLRLDRPYRCYGPLCPCSQQFLDVQLADKSRLGFVCEKWTCMIPTWEVVDASNTSQLLIKGPCCCVRNKSNDKFTIFRSNDERKPVGGMVTCQPKGDPCSDASSHILTFAIEMPVKVKALLLAAVFLIEYMYYEDDELGC
ncbi:phospholipid scramblase 3-like [Oscarella lobularis]|uniref:phospholipid scramblase 3-like n=1 Tax=Oscarella lobularis TaxID=121494 RepID=UPI003313A2BD